MNTKFLFSIVCGAALVLPCQTLMAASIGISASISCPDIGNSGTQKVVNNGSTVEGNGSERMHFPDSSSRTIFPLFVAATPAGVPLDLVAGGYANSGTAYNSSTNIVTCNFASTLGNPPFSIVYTLKNIVNGVVTSSGNEEIKIKFNVGIARN